MSRESLTEIIRMGRKVDPIIINALSRDSPEEFQSSLNYPFKVGGKRMRAALVMLSCAASGGHLNDSLKQAAIVEMVHNYSLVIDDNIDRGRVRRGKPTLRVQFGDSISILVAMFYREVLDNLIEESPRKQTIRSIVVQVMKEIIDGERLDLQFEQAGRQDPYLIAHRILRPSFQLYLNMIGKKTASLFRAAAEVGAHAAQADKKTVRALAAFGWKAGLAFQIMDDVLDICGEKTGKQKAKDIIEHKLGNAVILTSMKYLQPRDRAELMKTLATPRPSKGQVARARQLVMKTPAEMACREIAAEYLREAKNHLSTLEQSQNLHSLAALGEQIVSRTF